MNRKELLYANETKNYKGNFIAFLILSMCWLFLLFIESKEIFLVFCGVFLMLFVIFCFLVRRKISNYKRNLNIKQFGQRFEGYIVDLDHEVIQGSRTTRIYYYLWVKYFNPYTQQEVLYKTPRIGFNPIDDLGDRRCSVYIYGNDIYVSDFVARLENQNRIWSEEIVKTKNVNKLLSESIPKFMKIILVFIIIFLLIEGLLRIL